MENILIVDDHILVSLGIELLVKKTIKNYSIYKATNFDASLELVRSKTMTLVILDVMIPGSKGVDMIRIFKSIQSSIRVLVCSGIDELENAPRYMKAGAHGFLSKNAPDSEAEIAINTIMNGKKYVSALVQSAAINSLFSDSPSIQESLQLLSRREREVMDLVLEGRSVKDISSELKIKFSTVSTHKSRIFFKMDVDNSLDLLRKINSLFLQ